MNFPPIFRSFVPLKDGKIPATKYTDKDAIKYTYEDVCRGNYAGLLKPGWCFIDVDDEETAELLYKIIQEYAPYCHCQRTTRGYHFYYKNPGIKTNMLKCETSIGLQVELHVNKNQPVPLKIDGVEREWCWTLEDDEVGMLPIWLHHNPKVLEYDIKNIGSNEMRNDTLFRYKGHLLTKGFDPKDVSNTIRIINNYISTKPLSQRELNTVLRNENSSTKGVFYVDKKFRHDMFGDFLMNHHKFGMIEGRVHMQTTDYTYTADEDKIERAMVAAFPQSTDSQRKETLKYIKLICDKELQLSDENLIPLKDGVYDLRTGQMLDYNSRYVFKYKIPHSIRKEHKAVDTVLNNLCCNDQELRLLLEEIIGYGMFRRNELRKSFMLLGERRSGKSTFMTMLKRLYGSQNYATLSLADLEDRFRPAELDGKLINVGDDLDDKFIQNDSMFKTIVSGDTILVERKNKDPYSYTSTVKLIFATNKLPRVNDKGGGFLDRIVVFPFNANFDRSNNNLETFIIDDLTTEDALGYLLYVGLKGLTRIVENKGFTRPEAVQKEIDEYDLINNPHKEFILGCKIENEAVKDVRKKYKAWCEENDVKPLGDRNFGMELKRYLGLESKLTRISGEPLRIYVKIKQPV